jgi:hypothetical protein
VKRGDLLELPEDVGVVGIVDGVLLSDAAVGHREILQLMRRGTKVIGGGSMGALRAAELDGLGMIGVGRIYEEYSSGRIEGDDEVVLMFDPFTLTALSEPLINLRLNIENAARARVIKESDARIIIDRLKSTFYPRRSFEKLLAISNEILASDEMRDFEIFLKSKSVDFKRNDAISVIRTVKSVVQN